MRNNLLYQVKQIRALEKIAMEKYNISSDVLMQRAGQAAFRELKNHWPQAKNITVVCGKGNNAGDGYVVAYLAKKHNLNVQILQLVPYTELIGAARNAASECQCLQIETSMFAPEKLRDSDVIIDALFGIGLIGAVRPQVRAAIVAINASNIPVLAIDIPSGIDAATGDIMGAAIHAQVTVTFLALKVGLFLGAARAYTGKVICDALQLAPKVFNQVQAVAQILDLLQELKSLPSRIPTAHKGDFGHLLVVGGDYGMGGAVQMAAVAAARVGAGLVSVATRPEHVTMLNVTCPEIMAHGIKTTKQLAQLCQKVDIIVVGPGLGTGGWGKKLCRVVNLSKKRLVVDADALNILATHRQMRDSWILTPHPGEAARLLRTTIKNIQADRLTAVNNLQRQFGGIAILKGAGTLVATANDIRVCHAGNPGMASGGMGDVLSGIIGGLLAQGLNLFAAANLGVLVHAMAGDCLAAKEGEVGMLALDLLPEVRKILNFGGKRIS